MEPRDIVDTIIIVVVIIGSIWAVIRFYQDVTRPPEDDLSPSDIGGKEH